MEKPPPGYEGTKPPKIYTESEKSADEPLGDHVADLFSGYDAAALERFLSQCSHEGIAVADLNYYKPGSDEYKSLTGLIRTWLESEAQDEGAQKRVVQELAGLVV